MKVATLCYIRKGNKTLMVNVKKKGMNEGKWNGLGGKLEEGESPEDNVQREIKEETGLNVEEMVFKGIGTFPNDVGTGESWIIFIYVITKFSGKLITNSVEGDLKWIDNDKLLDLKLNPSDYIFIPWLDKKEIFSAKFPFEEEQTNYSVSFY